MRLLVTGCGKSGTRFVTQELRARGIDCGHESVFTHDRHGPLMDGHAEVSWLAAPFTPLFDTYTVHLVREPLQTIRSRALGEPGWGAFAQTKTHEHFRFASQLQPEMLLASGGIEAAAIHWVGWNLQVVADERLRLEDLDAQTLDRLAALLGGHPAPLGPPAAEHSADWPPLTWAEVAHVPGLRELAEEYGYPCS